MVHEDILSKTADTIRCLAMDAVQQANSGHPGMPMGCADFAALLWGKILKHNPKDPDWPDRDRFVLSAGHGSTLLYSALHLSGYDLSLEDIKRFRQWDAKTPGHPEVGHTPGVETTTGPLGQGFGNGVGMALAEAMLAARFGSDVVNHFTYGIVGDGDMMEGVSGEAASLAGHLKLGKLIYFYDSNRISIDGPTDLTYSDDAAKRFESYHWHVQTVDGHDMEAMEKALLEAQEVTDKPSLIIGITHIAKGSPNKQDTSDSHGAPLGEEEIKLCKQGMNWPEDKGFFVPEEVKAFFENRIPDLQEEQAQWQARYESLAPDLKNQWDLFMKRKLPSNLKELFPSFEKAIATRAASGQVLSAIAQKVENLVGGSADLAPSNKTFLKDKGVISPGEFGGRNFHFGVREHAMGAVLNGMALHKGFIPYGGTFLVFADYMRPSIRVAALSKLPVIYVFTHDSFYVGEDGPTHQPIEHLNSLRCIPNLNVIRPADAEETKWAWKAALERTDGPTALILSRQGLPLIDREKYAACDLENGAYLLTRNSDAPDLIFVATGSEAHLALDAAKELEKEGKNIHVVSLPCWELFDSLPQEKKDRILNPSCKKRLAIEAGVTLGWEKYVGDQGRVIGINHYGASAPAKVLAEKFGFTKERVLSEARTLLQE